MSSTVDQPLGPVPSRPISSQCGRAYKVICSAHASATSFLHIYHGRVEGDPTDEDEDLLRAMLLFAGSGLDAMVKQLITDALPGVIEQNEGAREQLRVFLARRLRAEEHRSELLATMLVSPQPNSLHAPLIDDLRAGSLQSSEALLRVGAYFDIATQELTSDVRPLDRVFAIRNQVAHEMDCDFSQANGHRRRRDYTEMTTDAGELFKFAASFLGAVDSRFFRTAAAESELARG
jgi:hypothetical protein